MPLSSCLVSSSAAVPFFNQWKCVQPYYMEVLCIHVHFSACRLAVSILLYILLLPKDSTWSDDTQHQLSCSNHGEESDGP